MLDAGGKSDDRDSGHGRLVSAYDLWAPVYDLTRLPFAWLARRVHRALDGVLRRHGGGRVLDLGAGTGFVRERISKIGLEPRLYVGVDVSRRMLARTRRLVAEDGARLVCAEAETAIAELQEDGERFDLIVSSLLLAHLETPEVIVGQAVELLDTGGAACFLFLSRGGTLPLRLLVRVFLWCLGGTPVDVRAIKKAMKGGPGSLRHEVVEQRSLGGCLVLLCIEDSWGPSRVEI